MHDLFGVHMLQGQQHLYEKHQDLLGRKTKYMLNIVNYFSTDIALSLGFLQTRQHYTMYYKTDCPLRHIGNK